MLNRNIKVDLHIHSKTSEYKEADGYVDESNIENIDVISIIDRIEVSKTRIEIFFKNLPITSCYIDSKNGKLHYDTLNS